MITINIVCGAPCSLKTTWAKHFFQNTVFLSAFDLYSEFKDNPNVNDPFFLEENLEEIWINVIVAAINRAPSNSGIVIDGDTKLWGVANLTTPEAVDGLIQVITEANDEGYIKKPFKIYVYNIALPLALRQILNHRRETPYSNEILRNGGTRDWSKLANLITPSTDEIFEKISTLY